MDKSNQIHEISFITKLVKNLSRSALQINAFQESDAELIRLPGTNIIIAITSDCIVEELERGLYTDPYTIGWMTVIANASDLSAVGAEPLGILLNQTFPKDVDAGFLKDLQQGINDACTLSNIVVLGGDTNFSSRLHMGGCALGLLNDNKIIMRTGCKPGDYLFASGRLGQGASYAFYKLILKNSRHNESLKFLPAPRHREGMIVRKYASCCMDSSDGMIATINQLMQLNKVGFKIETLMGDWVHEDAIELSNSMNIPLWWMLVGPHGEFELLFTIPPERVNIFWKAAAKIGWSPIMLGNAIEKAILEIPIDGKSFVIDTVTIRNLFDDVKGDLERFIQELKNIGYKMGIQ